VLENDDDESFGADVVVEDGDDKATVSDLRGIRFVGSDGVVPTFFATSPFVLAAPLVIGVAVVAFAVESVVDVNDGDDNDAAGDFLNLGVVTTAFDGFGVVLAAGFVVVTALVLSSSSSLSIFLRFFGVVLDLTSLSSSSSRIILVIFVASPFISLSLLLLLLTLRVASLLLLPLLVMVVS
jgi:hypothetical protein